MEITAAEGALGCTSALRASLHGVFGRVRYQRDTTVHNAGSTLDAVDTALRKLGWEIAPPNRIQSELFAEALIAAPELQGGRKPGRGVLASTIV
jgi:hypothetical protein